MFAIVLFFILSAEIRNDVSSQYHNALYTGDVGERVKILKSVGQGEKGDGGREREGGGECGGREETEGREWEGEGRGM